MLDAVGTLIRFGLAAVWLVSGWLKASDPNQTYVAVQAFDVLPPAMVGTVAAAVPYLELALGVLLVAGFATRLVAVLSAVLLLGFVAAVAQAWARGLSIDCGCFGGGGRVADGDTRYPQEIARDIGFLAMAGWLIIRPRTLFAVDGRFAGRVEVEEEPTGGRSGTDGA